MDSKPSAVSRSRLLSRVLHLLPWVLVAAEIICVAVYAAQTIAPRKIKPPPSAVPASAASTPSSSANDSSGFYSNVEFPEGRLFVTAARGAYQTDQMTLSVAKLALENLSIRGTTDDATLQSGIGLSDFSQMPMENLGNVIIFGWGGFAEPPASSKTPAASTAASDAATSDAATSDAAASDAAASGAAASDAAASDAAASDAAASDAAASDAAASDTAASGAAASDAAASDAAASGAAASGAAASDTATSGAAASSGASAPFMLRDGKFRGLETLSAGDTATLTYDGIRYSYICRDTKTFAEDDWAPLYIQGFSSLSLVSPVGNGQSVVARFELTGSESI